MKQTAPPGKGAKDIVEPILVIFFIVLAAIPLSWLVVKLVRYWGDAEIVSTQPIGHFISMSGPGGLGSRVVIETDQGSYPLLRAVTITKGTPLLLQVSASGRRYVCDQPRTLCIKTADEGFSLPAQGAQP